MAIASEHINNIEFTLLKKKRKTAAIRITKSGEIIVIMPLKWPDNKADEIIESKREWIEKQLLKVKQQNDTRIKSDENSIIYMGEVYKFTKNISMGKYTKIDKNKKEIISGLNLKNPIFAAQFYKEEAHLHLPEIVKRAAEKNGFKFTKISVRNTKTRWGSCNSLKNIVMSERLILAPVFVIEAIALHELVHTEIMNHSQDFYKRLYEVCPNYKEAEKWLIEKYPIEIYE